MTVDYKSGVMTVAVLHQVLEWAYTDVLDFEALSVTELLVLLKASGHFQTPRLVYLAECELRRRLTVDEVFPILKESTRLEMKDVKDLATSFAHQNWGQVCAHKAGMEIIGIELFQELTVAMQFYKPEAKVDCTPDALTPVPSTIVQDFREILNESHYSDAEFVFKDHQETMRFHRAIVAAHSRPLFQLISANNKAKQFTLEGLGPQAVRDLLQFIYYSDTDFDPLGACRLVEHTINQYALQHMLDDCLTSISEGIADGSSLTILRVTYLPNFEQGAPMRELREKALDHICRNFKAIAIPEVRSMQPPDVAYKMTADILDKLYHAYPMDESSADKKAKSSRHTKKKTRSGRTPREHSKKSVRESTEGSSA